MDEQSLALFKEQTTALYAAVGRFAVEFEHVCFTMRCIVMDMLDKSGLRDQRVMNILLAEHTAEPLRSLMAALIAETSQLSKQDRRIVSYVLSGVQELTKDRNDVLHSTWFIGWYTTDSGDFGDAPGVKPKRSGRGDVSLDKTWRIDQFNALIDKATMLCNHLRKMGACFSGGFKLENNFEFEKDGNLVARRELCK